MVNSALVSLLLPAASNLQVIGPKAGRVPLQQLIDSTYSLLALAAHAEASEMTRRCVD